MNLIIHTDGGARGNPGPAAIGVVIESCICVDPLHCTEIKRSMISGFGKKIGETTNNTAEYMAVIEALTFVKNNSATVHSETIVFVLDSVLVAQQLNGVFKIKQPHLHELMMRVRVLESDIGAHCVYTVVRREFNRDADSYVNTALDS